MTDTDKQYNVIWIFGDQHRAQMLGCNLDPNVSTPNIDRIANQGMNFERAVSGTPVCSPFRGSLLTSRYPHECVLDNSHVLSPEMPTIAQVFREQGYHTSYFGKWHLEGDVEGRSSLHVVPPDHRGGFDKWIGYENNNAQWDCWVHGTGIEEPQLLPGYETDSLTDLFIDNLRERAEKNSPPFFAALSVQPPHTPYVAPEEWMRRHTPASVELPPNVPPIPGIEAKARREFAGACGMIENLDWNVGRIIAALEKNGLADNTYIVFFSDHGDLHGSHGKFRKMQPWEESIRIPMVISAAGSLGTRYGGSSGRPPAVMNHVDIAPTTLGLCGIPQPDWMRGFDYSGYVRKGADCPDPPESAYLQGPFLGGDTKRRWRGIVTIDNWKYVCFERHPWLMFNLNEDPYELNNLAYSGKQYRNIRQNLQDKLREWIEGLDDEFELPKL